MIGFSRTNKGLLANWWWTVDRWLLAGMAMLVLLGFVMAFAASPAVAHRLELPTYHFAYRQFAFMSLAVAVVLGVSLMPPEWLRRAAFIGGILALIGMAFTLFGGDSIKGARRWVRVFGFSVQPSEFLKPCFIVAVAWCFALQNTRFNFHGQVLAFLIYLMTAALLLMQPDFGQTVLLTFVWGGLFFISGGSYAVIAFLAFLGMGGLVAAFHFYPHVQSRIERFINPASGDTYQVEKAVEAIQNGGLLGAGFGDGRYKSSLPDAHTDYVFAVAAEEGGVLFGILIIAVFAGIVLRALWRIQQEKRHWIQLAATGLVALFGVQSFLNIAVNLNMLPAKGMTLPFISYGGSSLLALAFTVGMILSLTRKRLPQGQFAGRSVQEVSLTGALMMEGRS
ncbi:MAG: FtsW/RodA/SpoVE family cell cycle protein [Parvibaculales bacterium]